MVQLTGTADQLDAFLYDCPDAEAYGITIQKPVEVFVYTLDGSVYMIFATSRKEADAIVLDDALNGDDRDLHMMTCVGYGVPKNPGSFVLMP